MGRKKRECSYRFGKMLKEAFASSGKTVGELEAKAGYHSGYLRRMMNEEVLPEADEEQLTRLADELAFSPSLLIEAAMCDRAEKEGVLQYFLIRERLLNHPRTDPEDAIVQELRRSSIDLGNSAIAFGIAAMVRATKDPTAVTDDFSRLLQRFCEVPRERRAELLRILADMTQFTAGHSGIQDDQVLLKVLDRREKARAQEAEDGS